VLKDVVKQFKFGGSSLAVLNGISLDVDAGEMIAVVGRSGSGKTTLLSVIGGLLRPTSGNVIVDGADIANSSESDLVAYRRRKVGFVFQDFNLIPSLNALENVTLPYYYAGRRDGDGKVKAEEALGSAEILHRAKYRVSVLSGGEQQRVAIARALINDPDIILADEPTGNLDYETGKSIISLLAKLAHLNKKAVITVTHDWSVRMVADRSMAIKDGVIVGEQQEAVDGKKSCDSCSRELPADAKFCMYCGTSLKKS